MINKLKGKPMNNNKLLNPLKINNKPYTYFSSLGYLPNPDRVMSKTPSTYDDLRELKHDAHLWSCIQSRKSGVLNLKYEINSNTKINNLFDKIFDNLNFNQLLRDILEAPLFGFQPFEIKWIKHKNMYIPETIIPLKQEYFVFDESGNPKIKDIRRNVLIDIPEYKIIFAKYESSAVNPYGESLLSKCYWHCKFKNGGLKLWVQFMEKYGSPYIIGKFNRGANQDDMNELLDALFQMSEDSVFVSPNDIDLEIIEPNRKDSVDLYKELIKQCNNEISKAILSQTLTTELDMGSYAASQTHFKIRKEVVYSDAMIAERFINELISYIIKINFAEINNKPKFSFLLDSIE